MAKELISIRILDLDGKRGSDSADALMRYAQREKLEADIWSVGCMLEIARWGLTNKTPALVVDGHIICSGGPLSDGMLERCAVSLAKMQRAAAANSDPTNDK